MSFLFESQKMKRSEGGFYKALLTALQQFSPMMHMHLHTFWLLLNDSSKLVQLDLHSFERE